MYRKIVELLEADISPEEISTMLDLPIRQIRAIEADHFEFI